jgi:hypothetical protein
VTVHGRRVLHGRLDYLILLADDRQRAVALTLEGRQSAIMRAM